MEQYQEASEYNSGLRNSAGKKRQLSSNDDDDATRGAKKDNQEWVQQVIDTLGKQHGEKFTSMQYRLWAKMATNGIHTSMIVVPAMPMFKINVAAVTLLLHQKK